MSHNIASIRGVVGSGKAIKSVAPDGVVTWFYRDGRDFVAFHENAGRHTIDFDTIERNINHKSTDVESVPVEESPFDG